ncbi:MAG: hypothetical protein MN733_17120, partial [Nitrososphaera sp.]|nr:hypothetical protein [Nitrososphaera sp.]
MPDQSAEDKIIQQGLGSFASEDAVIAQNLPHNLGIWENIGFGFDLPGRGLRKFIKGAATASPERIWSGVNDWSNFVWWGGTLGQGPLFVEPDDRESFGLVLDFVLDPTLVVHAPAAIAKVAPKIAGIISKAEKAGGLAAGTLRGSKLREVLLASEKAAKEGGLGGSLFNEFQAISSELFKHTTPAFQKNVLAKARTGALDNVLSPEILASVKKLASGEKMTASARTSLMQQVLSEHLGWAAKNTAEEAAKDLTIRNKVASIFKAGRETIPLEEEILKNVGKTLERSIGKGTFIRVPGVHTGGLEWSYKQLTDLLPINTLGRLGNLANKKSWLSKEIAGYKDLRTLLGSYIPDLPVLKLPVSFFPDSPVSPLDLKYLMPSFWALKGIAATPLWPGVKSAFTRSGKAETGLGGELYESYMNEITSARQKAQNEVASALKGISTEETDNFVKMSEELENLQLELPKVKPEDAPEIKQKLGVILNNPGYKKVSDALNIVKDKVLALGGDLDLAPHA